MSYGLSVNEVNLQCGGLELVIKLLKLWNNFLNVLLFRV